MDCRAKPVSDQDVIRKAYFALAGSRSPSLTKKQQEEELARCWYLLAEAMERHQNSQG